jgi:hypothetical protein
VNSDNYETDDDGVIDSRQEDNDEFSMPCDLGIDAPAQPKLKAYPQTKFYKRNRSFQQAWYSSRNWLEYSVSRDRCYCYPCRIFTRTEKLKDRTFTVCGFGQWKTATEKNRGFHQHASCQTHLSAVAKWCERESRITNETGIDTMLCAKQINDNQYYILSVFDVVQFLVMNEMPFRGDRETEAERVNPSDSFSSGKFLNLFAYTIKKDEKLRAIIPTLPENAKYTSPEIQNEVIEMMAEMALQQIVSEIKSSDADCYTIKCDGTRDKNNVENMSLVVRYVKDGAAKERLIEMTQLDHLHADYISDVILTRLKDVGLDPNRILSQCYDGASVMSGKLGGVQAKLQEKVGKEIPYVHCFNHQLHLVIVHALEVDIEVKQFFDTCDALYKFTRRPNIDQIYDGVKLKRLLDQRWTGHLATVETIIGSFAELEDMLVCASRSTSLGSEVLALAVGYLSQIQNPQFRVLAHILLTVLSSLKPANLILQAESVDLSAGIAIIDNCVEVLRGMREDESGSFQKIWETADISKYLPSSDSVLSGALKAHSSSKRICRPNSKHRDSIVMVSLGQRSQPTEQTMTEEEKLKSSMKRIFCSIIDGALMEIDHRFGERSKAYVRALTGLLPGTDNFLDLVLLKPLVELLHIDEKQLGYEVNVAKKLIESRASQSCQATFAKMNDAMQALFPLRDGFPLLYKLLASALTFGASTAVCENSFSTLTRMLTPYRRSMMQRRLSNLVLLAFEKDVTNSLDRKEFLNKFRSKTRRLKI